jgi:hypothetical protein
MMRELRSPNQILFSHLPEQTVDLRGRVWKVDRWKNPLPLPVDQEAVRRRLLGAVEIWRANGQDNDFAAALHQQRAIEVVGVNPDEGVKVDAFPDLWRCQNCRRVQRKPGRCVCGVDSWAQLHFVAFHECGWSDAPRPASTTPTAAASATCGSAAPFATVNSRPGSEGAGHAPDAGSPPSSSTCIVPPRSIRRSRSRW